MTGGNISLTKFPGDIVSGYLAHLVSDLFRITQSNGRPSQPSHSTKVFKNEIPVDFIVSSGKCLPDRRHAYHVLPAPSLIEPAFQ